MPRKKKTSSTNLELSTARVAGLESLDPALDLGSGLTIGAYRAAIADVSAKLSAYNTLLAQADSAQLMYREADKALGDLSSRMLAGIAARYGRNSKEYEAAGGTRSSERRRRPNAPAAPAAAGS